MLISDDIKELQATLEQLNTKSKKIGLTMNHNNREHMRKGHQMIEKV